MTKKTAPEAAEDVVIPPPSPFVIAGLGSTGVHLEMQFSQARLEAEAVGDDDPDAIAATKVAQNVDAWHTELVDTLPAIADDLAPFYGQHTHDAIQGRRQALKAYKA